MLSSLKFALVLSGAFLVGSFVGATGSLAPAHADAVAGSNPAATPASEPAPPPLDPNKKKEGELCNNSSECQRHHRCVKVGDQSICKAPPRPVLPPGAVT